jgi:hypothetical protein
MADDHSADNPEPSSPGRPGSPDPTSEYGEPLYEAKYAMRPSTAVIEALATVMEKDLTDLPTMYETVDFESLDTLFRNPTSMQRPGEVKFPVNEYTFLVTSDGWIAVWDERTADQPPHPSE